MVGMKIQLVIGAEIRFLVLGLYGKGSLKVIGLYGVQI